MSPKSPKLRAGVGAVALLMPKFVQPSNPIRDNYPNRPNNHTLQRVGLVEEDVKFVRRGADAIPVFVFTHANFTDQQFYAAKRYIHVTQKGTEDSLFVLAEAPVPDAGAGGICALLVGGNNHTDGTEANDAPNLILGFTSNLRLEDMTELLRQGSAIDDDKNPALENVPRKGETTAGTGNRRREDIILPQKAGNLQFVFSSFRYYSHDAILFMSLLQLFLIMFPEDYLDKFLIPDINKGLSVPMDIQEFIKWVSC